MLADYVLDRITEKIGLQRVLRGCVIHVVLSPRQDQLLKPFVREDCLSLVLSNDQWCIAKHVLIYTTTEFGEYRSD